jgi:hypothetical protein
LFAEIGKRTPCFLRFGEVARGKAREPTPLSNVIVPKRAYSLPAPGTSHGRCGVSSGDDTRDGEVAIELSGEAKHCSKGYSAIGPWQLSFCLLGFQLTAKRLAFASCAEVK